MFPLLMTLLWALQVCLLQNKRDTVRDTPPWHRHTSLSFSYAHTNTVTATQNHVFNHLAKIQTLMKTIGCVQY